MKRFYLILFSLLSLTWFTPDHPGSAPNGVHDSNAMLAMPGSISAHPLSMLLSTNPDHEENDFKSFIASGALEYPLLAQKQATSTPPATPEQEEPEALTRGPVHEAFAEPVDMKTEEGVKAPDPPPANLNEMPPTEKPVGDHFLWVSGYWSWDGDRKNYIWVSGCWRQAPPHTYWIPGYWSKTSGGYVWVAGFWAPEAEEEIEYLPDPPPLDTLDAVEAAPTPDSIWVPPCWYWDNQHYIIRSGYWLTAQPGWVWLPSHYVVTPHGCVFVHGCWDYDLDRRGVLFAPVYVRPAVAARAGFVYSPGIVLDLGALRLSLFAYPRYCHYVFGDYYDDAYIHVGIYPWFEFESVHGWYDPIFVHDRWEHRRSDPHWEETIHHDYDVRRNDKTQRPARTFAEMNAQAAKAPEAQCKNVVVAQPINVVVNNKTTTNIKFQKIDAKTRDTIVKEATETRDLSQKRSNWESTSSGRPAAVPAPADSRTGAGRADEHRGAETPPKAEPRGGAQTPPVEPKGSPIPSPARGATPPNESKGGVTPTPGKPPTAAPPAEERPSESQRVKVPRPARGAGTGSSGETPPAHPNAEESHKAPGSDGSRGRDNRGRN